MELDNIATTEGAFTKVGNQEGSNPGGWYKKEGIDELYYVKLYLNPDNARIEYLANHIYNKLGVPAPVSILVTSGDSLFVASKKIGQGIRATLDEQKADVGLKNGFITDAYLNNWDVVGEFFDNIVKDESGKLYRVDNGGAGPIRANGKPKNFSPSEIKELSDMRNPKFQAGQVFGTLQDKDLVPQAKHLVETLDDVFIDQTIAYSGLRGEIAELTRVGLKGRKQYLKEVFLRGTIA